MATRNIMSQLRRIVGAESAPSGTVSDGSTTDPDFAPLARGRHHLTAARPDGNGPQRTGSFSQVSAGSVIASALEAQPLPSAFIDQLKQWVQSDSPEGHVQRQQAMERIVTAHRQNAVMLDLGGLALTSLPNMDSLNHLQCLYLGGNQLTSLPLLPASIRDLDVTGNYLMAPGTVPTSLRLLNAANNSALGESSYHQDALRRCRDVVPRSEQRRAEFDGGVNRFGQTEGRLFFRTSYFADDRERQDANLSLEAWISVAVDRQAGYRLEAAHKIMEARINGATELSLRGLSVGSLPDCLSKLWSVRNLDISDCGLQSLFDLPLFLTTLDASYNSLGANVNLTQLNQLRTLRLDCAGLTALDYVPMPVTLLYLSNNHLRELPSLPEPLSSSRRSLTTLDVGNNQWNAQSIHEIRNMNDNVDVYFSDSEEVSTAAFDSEPLEAVAGEVAARLGQLSESDQSAPDFNLDDGSRHTHEQIARYFMLWHIRSESPTSGSMADWEKIAAEPNASFFSGFLAEIQETEEYKNPAMRPALKKTIGDLVDELFKSPEFRETIFTIAMDASASCHDRVASTFNDMKRAKINHDAEQGKYTNKELSDLGRAMFRLEILNHIAERTIKTQEERYRHNPVTENKVDPIEIRLGFQVMLAERLDIKHLSRDMRYFATANLTDADIDAAEAEVLRLDSGTKHVAFLQQWTPWQKAMQRENKEEFVALQVRIDKEREWLLFPNAAMNSNDYRDEATKQGAHVVAELERFTARSTWKFLGGGD